MERTETKYVKRTQKDYSMSFKLSVVQEYETTRISLSELQRKYGIQGSDTIRRWIEKFGNFDVSNQTHRPMEKNKDRQLLELEQKVRMLERRNARLEKELEQKDMKADFFDMMIDIAEKEYISVSEKTTFPNSPSIQRRKIRKYHRTLPTARGQQAEILPSATESGTKPGKSGRRG